MEPSPSHVRETLPDWYETSATLRHPHILRLDETDGVGQDGFPVCITCTKLQTAEAIFKHALMYPAHSIPLVSASEAVLHFFNK
jgi:hypothetical protein